MSVLIRTDSHVLLFTINDIAESAASNLHHLCQALYGPPQHQAKRHHSCPEGSAWGSHPCRMAGGGKRREDFQIGKWCADTIRVTHPQLLSAVLLAISTLEFSITYINHWIFCFSVFWVYLYETLLVLFWPVWPVFFWNGHSVCLSVFKASSLNINIYWQNRKERFLLSNCIKERFALTGGLCFKLPELK